MKGLEKVSLLALEKIYDKDVTLDEILEDYSNDFLSVFTARNGRPVLWFFCNREKCIYLDGDLEELSQEELERELL